MHNPTRRMKQFKRPLSPTKPHPGLPEPNDITLDFVLGQDSPGSGSPSHVRHRRAAQPDTLRGAMLVALVVVTVVLYLVLWELERPSLTSVPKPNMTQMAASPQSSGNLGGASTRYPPTIVQDRAVFPLGKEFNLSDDHIAVPSSKPGRKSPKTWPPPVTRVPEENDIRDLTEQTDDRTHADGLGNFDATYCSGTCRFLLPVRIGEQESKARMHLMQLSALARRLDRTIILPNVGKSRMGACSKWPFGAYYDTDGFAHGNDGSSSRPAIDLEEFAKWVDERPTAPNCFVVSMESLDGGHRYLLGTQSGLEDVPFIVGRSDVDPKALSCLESKFPRLHASLPETALSILFDSGSLKTESDASRHLLQLMSNSQDMDAEFDFDLMMEPGYEYTPQYTDSHVPLAEIDVLVLDYDLRHPLFAQSESDFVLHYAPGLYDLADRLSENLGPFLGVHWRMENVPAQNLAWCAASLVSTLRALLQDDFTGENVRHVWLATDHPRPLSSFVDVVHSPLDDDWTLSGVGSGEEEISLRNYGPQRKSSTFKGLSIEHDDAIGILTEAFQPGGDLEAWKLTDLAEQLRRYPYVEGRFEVNETLLNDSGVFGILDKLVIVQARVFVSGSKDCSKTSSFSKQVIETRQETFEAERSKGAIRNTVEYFGKW